MALLRDRNDRVMFAMAVVVLGIAVWLDSASEGYGL